MIGRAACNPSRYILPLTAAFSAMRTSGTARNYAAAGRSFAWCVSAARKFLPNSARFSPFVSEETRKNIQVVFGPSFFKDEVTQC